MPRDVLERLNAETKALPAAKQEIERRKKIEAWIDAGHGSCVLNNPDIAAMAQGALLFFHSQRYQLLAWVIMPNHIHVLFRPLNSWLIAKIVASWKKLMARKICDYRRHNGRAANANQEIGGPGTANLLIGASTLANPEIGVPVPGEPVWHREYWDRYIRDEEHFQQVVNYIHQNPVTAGLVRQAQDWRWSSAYPGNADLLIGESRCANQEIGVPGNANQEIGVPRNPPPGTPIS